MASRRRRRKSIGKVIVDVERRVRRVEKRPGAKRLKTNVVTTEKLGFRAVTTKTVAPDAITPNEAAFGTPVVSETEPTEYLKAGSNWFNPDTGEQKVYDPTSESFLDVAAVDLTARASADGKNTIYRQNAQPTGGTYVTGDTWFDEDDNNKIYRYNGTAWVALQLGGNALANISANSVNTGTLNANLITVSNLDVGTMTTGNLSATRISAGTISASISITAPTITSGGLTINADGSITTSTGNFGLSTTGVVTATGVDITGEINATSGTFTGYVTGGTARFGANVDSTNDGIWIDANNYWYDTGSFKVGDGTESMSYSSAGGLVVTGEISAGTFSGNITSTATIAGGTITSTGTIGSYGSNTLTISGGKLSANSVIYLESTSWIDLTAVSGLSINADTEITGSIELSGDTLFNGFTNQINVDTDVGGTSTKNIRNVWIRSTLVATNASIPDSQIGDIWLQYA